MAARPRVREQHIAVFGGSGSGKTVLVSSFYGAAQELSFLKDSLFHVIADDAGQGHRLRKNFLGMKNSAKTPELNRFVAKRYSFSLKPKDDRVPEARRATPPERLRLVWHDYPGEWFEDEPSSDEESTRRVETFRTLLRSDVALVLVDGQMLLDYPGEEEKYLKSLFGDLRENLLRLKDDLLDGDQPLERFPRIWILALSKSDLHPELDVHQFRDLVIEKAGDDAAALHDVLRGFVQLPEALSMGEDFLLLSSAQFEPGKIEVEKRIGLDLILPLAALLPLERLVQWAERFDIPRRLLDVLVANADALAGILIGADRLRDLIKRIPKIGPWLAGALPAVAAAIRAGAPRLEERIAQARANHELLTAILAQFQLDLRRGEAEGVFAKSLK